MIKVLWLNFSGGRGQSQFDDSNATVIVGDLVSKDIPQSHTFICNCGQCKYTEVDGSEIISNKVSHNTRIEKISLRGMPVNFDTYTKAFYKEFFNAVREKFPNAYYSNARNIAIDTKDGEVNIQAIIESMINKLTNQGYRFNSGKSVAKPRIDNFPLQINNEDRNKLVAWLAEKDISQVHSQNPSIKLDNC